MNVAAHPTTHQHMAIQVYMLELVDPVGILQSVTEERRAKIDERKEKRGMDVAEIFSRPRVCERARRRGLVGSWSLDIAAVDPHTSKKWDLQNPGDVKAAWNLFYRSKPELLVCSPPCTVFSTMQNLNVTPERWAEAVAYVKLCVAMCKAQQRVP